MQKKTMFGVRLDEDLAQWLKHKAKTANCAMSDVIYDAILLSKKLDDIPEDMRFSTLLQIKGAKAAIKTFRLLERFVQLQKSDPKEILIGAIKTAEEDLAAVKL